MKTFIKNTISRIISTIVGITLIISIAIGAIGTVQGAFLLFGPDYKQGYYEMTYKVYFPNNPKVYTINNEYPIGVNSCRGTNYVTKTIKGPLKNMFISNTIFESSAPIEVVSYTFKAKLNK